MEPCNWYHVLKKICGVFSMRCPNSESFQTKVPRKVGMVFVFFGNPVYGKRPAPGCSCIGQHYFGCGYNGPYVYNALLASTGSPAFGTVQEPKRAKYACFLPGRVCMLWCSLRSCAHLLTSLFIVQNVEDDTVAGVCRKGFAGVCRKAC